MEILEQMVPYLVLTFLITFFDAIFLCIQFGQTVDDVLLEADASPFEKREDVYIWIFGLFLEMRQD